MSVLIVTSLGDIVVDLFTDRCPLTSKNFLKLCKIKYYNGCLFHTVQKDFTAQTGDPTGSGTGGDSIYKFLYGDQARFFGDEIHLDVKHSKIGTVAMASAGEHLNASQFYFTLRDDIDYLDGKHTVFGEVAEGLETLSRLNEAFVDDKGRPFKNIRVKHTYILDDPFDDPPQLAELIPEASPEGKPRDEVDDDVRLEDDWVPMDEQLSAAELEEVIRVKDAHSSAVVLETIGDIPEAEIKPPDNVLFVCKLNPVTEDEDLHTIFSRFGIVTSAEIIRDYKTGDSLCYAFIEFETKEACEQAYFKMDNALIDDRRIHVDFSQSVAKLWSQYRRKDNQNGKGRGCYKCGAPDHIAKDCTEGSGSKSQPPKYILKDEYARGNAEDNQKYEMVFDDDHARSPERRGGQSRKLEEGIESQKSSRRVEDRPRTDQGRQSSSTRYSHSERSRGYEEDHSRHRDSRITRSNGSRREHEHQERRSKREINLEDRGDRDKYRRIERGNRDKYRRDGRDGRNGTEDSDGHRDSRERDYKKKGADGGSGRERRDVGTGQKRSADEDNRDDERDDKHYGIRRAEKDGHRARRDERESRSMHSNDRDIDRHSRHHGDGRR